MLILAAVLVRIVALLTVQVQTEPGIQTVLHQQVLYTWYTCYVPVGIYQGGTTDV